MMQRVIAGDLACTFTTCTSVSERVKAAPDSYMPNPAIYMLQTSVGAWDYSIILSNAKAKAAAMVVANEMLDPSQQAIAFQTTGNGYNVDYGKLDAPQKKEFDDVISAMGTLSPSTEEIALQSYTDKFGVVAQWIPTGWVQKVQSA
jgi:spermidine/putrescine-binding protein